MSTPLTPEHARELLGRAQCCWHARDFDALTSLVTDDSSWTGRGRAAGSGAPPACRGIEMLRIRDGRVRDGDAVVFVRPESEETGVAAS